MSGTRPTLTERDRVAPIPTTRLDHCHRTNPRPCTEADLEQLLDQAW